VAGGGGAGTIATTDVASILGFLASGSSLMGFTSTLGTLLEAAETTGTEMGVDDRLTVTEDPTPFPFAAAVINCGGGIATALVATTAAGMPLLVPQLVVTMAPAGVTVTFERLIPLSAGVEVSVTEGGRGLAMMRFTLPPSVVK
jgi:hypothetical protein